MSISRSATSLGEPNASCAVLDALLDVGQVHLPDLGAIELRERLVLRPDVVERRRGDVAGLAERLVRLVGAVVPQRLHEIEVVGAVLLQRGVDAVGDVGVGEQAELIGLQACGRWRRAAWRNSRRCPASRRGGRPAAPR